MPSTKNHYQILNIPYDATLNEIKIAYRALANKYHPDKNIGSDDIHNIESFQAVNLAYDTLSDTVKRKKYDIQILKNVQWLGTQKANSINDIYKKTSELEHFLIATPKYAINQPVLTNFILNILQPQNIAILKKVNTSSENREFVLKLYKGLIVLNSYTAFTTIAQLLFTFLENENDELFKQINTEINSRRKIQIQNKIIPIITIIIIIIIAIISYLKFLK